jgi:protein-tyrosine phosphatase
MFKSILILCTGNICRSPIAEGLFRARLKRKEILVGSAGVAAMVGWPADDMAIEVMREAGLDIRAHRARQVTLPMLNQHDLVLTLDQTHSDWVNRMYPQFRGRVHKVLKWRDNRDVEDPYCQPKSAFEQSYEDIELGLEDWLKRLD